MSLNFLDLFHYLLSVNKMKLDIFFTSKQTISVYYSNLFFEKTHEIDDNNLIEKNTCMTFATLCLVLSCEIQKLCIGNAKIAQHI